MVSTLENSSEKYEPHMIPKWGNTARYHDMIIRASFVDDTYYIKLHQRNWTNYEWHSFLGCLMPRNKSHLVEGSSLYIEFNKIDHAFAYKKRIKDALGWGEEE